MPPARPPRRNSDESSGLSFTMLVPGAFYQGVMPGGFTDALTSIHIPGPKAVLGGPTKREVISLTELPEPVQIPHVKLVSEKTEGGKVIKEVERDFTAPDEQPVHEGFMLALASEVIRLVPEEEMQERFPETWANRQEHYVYRTQSVTKNQKSYASMMVEALQAGDLARHREAALAAEMDLPREPAEPASTTATAAPARPPARPPRP